MLHFLIILGLMIIITGVCYLMGEKVGIGKLPGDFYIKKENFSFYFPLTTSILISCFITIILWLVGKYK
jgi:hypothetical protein